MIADATFIRRADRDRVRAVAARRGVACVFVECRSARRSCARDSRRGRLTTSPTRAGRPTSTQTRASEPLGADEPRIVITTDGTPEEARSDALAALWAWRYACEG